MRKNWDDILHPDQSFKDCQPLVKEAAVAVLERLEPGEHWRTGYLVNEILGDHVRRRTRKRFVATLKALSKQDNGLKRYHFTKDGPNIFKPGDTCKHSFWRTYEAPPPEQHCEFCGQVIKETDQ